MKFRTFVAITALLTAATPALAQSDQSVRDILNRAQSDAERRSVEDLIGRLRGGNAQPAAPAAAPAPGTPTTANPIVPPAGTVPQAAAPSAPAVGIGTGSASTAIGTAPATQPGTTIGTAPGVATRTTRGLPPRVTPSAPQGTTPTTASAPAGALPAPPQLLPPAATAAPTAPQPANPAPVQAAAPIQPAPDAPSTPAGTAPVEPTSAPPVAAADAVQPPAEATPVGQPIAPPVAAAAPVEQPSQAPAGQPPVEAAPIAAAGQPNDPAATDTVGQPIGPAALFPVPVAPVGTSDDVMARAPEIAKSKGLPTVDVEVLFGYDSAAVTPRAAESLMVLGRALADPRLAGAKFVIAGHTDARGTRRYNGALSQRRAAAVREFLVEHFKVPPANLIARGFGESRLKNPRDPGGPENRRVQIINWSSEVIGANRR